MTDEIVTQLEPEQVIENRPKRILIVDDDEGQVNALQYRLNKLGYVTSSAASGREALQVAEQRHPDLALVDLRLPDTSGFEVCEQLSDSPTTCGMPVIIVSAMERPDIIRRARSVGCEYYVRKPYDPNVLLTLIEHALKSDDLDWEA